MAGTDIKAMARQERAALCDLMAEVGPDAPTLCEGWTTHDLAAHLFIRERRPHAAVGLLGGPLAAVTERATKSAKGKGYGRLVDAVRSGPPLLWRPFDGVANLFEYLVHLEDVRRTGEGWTRRQDPALDTALWAHLGKAARFLTRRVKGVGLTLERADVEGEADATVVARKGEPVAVVRGGPQELVLFLYGRRDVADVEIDGPPEARQVVEATDFSA